LKQLYIKYLFLFFYINLPTFIDEEPKKTELNRSAFFVYIHIRYYLKLQYSSLNYVQNV